jgi:membrane-bound lytic murein transglycosylase B
MKGLNLIKALGVAVTLIVAAFAIVKLTEPEAATISTLVTPTATPDPTPTVEATPVATPTPSVSATPKPKVSPIVNARVSYVQEQLVAAGFTKTEAVKFFADPRLKLYTIKTVAYKEPDWQIIEDKLTSETYLQEGRDYLALHRSTFEKMESTYGVSREVLAGLIAIETEFGKNPGGTITFNALYSRMRQWPEATWKAQAAQLVALSTYCLRSNTDCYTIKGSYAGAIGLVQFMPNSLLAYGVDGNADGKVDLMNPVDAIPSAANFLVGHGYKEDQFRSLARYYGSSVGYPDIVLKYANLVRS